MIITTSIKRIIKIITGITITGGAVLVNVAENQVDRNYGSSYRSFNDLHRCRTERYLDEDWKTGRKISTCESDDADKLLKLLPHIIPLPSVNSNSIAHRLSPTGHNNAQPGVLIMSNGSNQSSNQSTSQQYITHTHTHTHLHYKVYMYIL